MNEVSSENVLVKTCSRCKKEKPLTSEFWAKAKMGKYGFKARCKKCENLLSENYRQQNRERIRRVSRDLSAQYYSQNRRAVSGRISLNHRAKEHNVPGRVSTKEVADLFEKYPVCLCCRCSLDLEIDHVVPLSKGGDNVLSNLQVLCRVCNSVKDTRTIDYRFNSGFIKNKTTKGPGMNPELAELLKELLVIIDEFRVIDDPETKRRLGIDSLSPLDGVLVYDIDFVDTYEAIRAHLVEVGVLPSENHLPTYQ